MIQKNIKEGVIAPVDVPTDVVSLCLVTDFRGLDRIIKRWVWSFSSSKTIIKSVDP